MSGHVGAALRVASASQAVAAPWSVMTLAVPQLVATPLLGAASKAVTAMMVLLPGGDGLLA